MWLFFVLLFTTLFVACICKTSTYTGSKKYVAFMFSIIAFLMMFRGYTVGNDTDNYTRLYEIINKYSELGQYISSSRYEIGYVVLNRAIGTIFGNVQWLFIITGAFVSYCFARYIYNYSKVPWMSVLMFLTLQFFDLSMSSVRQVLSIAILTIAYDQLIKRKPIHFAIIVFFASLFHSSSLVFLILYPLSRKKQDRKLYITSGVVAVIGFFAFDRVFRMVARIFPQYTYYLTQSSISYSNSAKLATLLMFVLYLTLFIIIKLLQRTEVDSSCFPGDDKSDKRMISQYYRDVQQVDNMAIWLGVIMLMFSLYGTILIRFKYIFSFPLLIAYPNSIWAHDNKNNKLVLYFVSCIVFVTYNLIIYIYRPEWQSTYPFVPFWND